MTVDGNAGFVGSVHLRMPLAMLITGCTQDGGGSIKVGDPQSVRARAPGGLATKEPVSQKQAAALKAEDEAAKKNPKLY